MPEIRTLTDQDYEAVLNDRLPVLILFSTGEGLRGDFSTAFKNAAAQQAQMAFAQIDPVKNPGAAQRFDIGDKPVLVAWFNGEELARRSRPWGADVTLAIETLQAKVREAQPPMAVVAPNGDAAKAPVEPVLVDTKPVAVTDATFEKEVLLYHLPVVVDFWAPWCGPCRQVAPIFDKLAGEFAGKVRVAKVNTDENPLLSQQFRIEAIPTIAAVKDRTLVFLQAGALPEAALRDLFTQLVALKVPPQGQPQAPKNPPVQPKPKTPSFRPPTH